MEPSIGVESAAGHGEGHSFPFSASGNTLQLLAAPTVSFTQSSRQPEPPSQQEGAGCRQDPWPHSLLLLLTGHFPMATAKTQISVRPHPVLWHKESLEGPGEKDLCLHLNLPPQGCPQNTAVTQTPTSGPPVVPGAVPQAGGVSRRPYTRPVAPEWIRVVPWEGCGRGSGTGWGLWCQGGGIRQMKGRYHGSQMGQAEAEVK